MNSLKELKAHLRARVGEVLASCADKTLARDLVATAAPCLALVPAPRRRPRPKTIFGGAPKVPRGFAWPTTVLEGVYGDDGKPRYMNFLGQIDLAELPDVKLGLPHSGTLYLFSSLVDAAAYPVEVRGILVGRSPERLVTAKAPDPDRLCDEETLNDLKEVPVTAEPALSLPLGVRRIQRRIRAIEKQQYDVLIPLHDVARELMPQHAIGQIGGWANPHGDADLYRTVAFEQIGKPDLVYRDYWDSLGELQAAIKRHPELATQYRSWRPEVKWILEHRRKIEATADAFRLLLRLDSNRAMDLQINDADPIYLFVRKKDLAARRFDRMTARVTQG